MRYLAFVCILCLLAYGESATYKQSSHGDYSPNCAAGRDCIIKLETDWKEYDKLVKRLEQIIKEQKLTKIELTSIKTILNREKSTFRNQQEYDAEFEVKAVTYNELKKSLSGSNSNLTMGAKRALENGKPEKAEKLLEQDYKNVPATNNKLLATKAYELALLS